MGSIPDKVERFGEGSGNWRLLLNLVHDIKIATLGWAVMNDWGGKVFFRNRKAQGLVGCEVVMFCLQFS